MNKGEGPRKDNSTERTGKEDKNKQNTRRGKLNSKNRTPKTIEGRGGQEYAEHKNWTTLQTEGKKSWDRTILTEHTKAGQTKH